MGSRNLLAAGLNELAESLEIGASMLLAWTLSPSAFRRDYVTGRLPREEWEALWKPRSEYQSRRTLEKKGWIRSKKNGDEIVVRLHKDAVSAILKERIKKTKTRLSDDQICLIVFDIPESSAVVRQAWRRFLRGAKFGQVQKSAWATDRDVAADMSVLIKLVGIERWACVYVAYRK